MKSEVKSVQIEREWYSLGVHIKTAQKLAKEGLLVQELLALSSEEMEARLDGFSPAGKRSVQEALVKASAQTPKETEASAAVDNDSPSEEAGEAEVAPVADEPPAEPVAESETKPEASEPKFVAAPKPSKSKVKSAGLKKAQEILGRLGKDVRGMIEIASQSKALDYKKQSTGFRALDAVTGGGFPKGKFSVVLGEERTCKSTVCLHAIAKDHHDDPESVWIWDDAENSFDTSWAAKIGVDLDRVIIIPPLLLEDSVTEIESMISDGGVSGVVVDSVSAWLPEQEVKKDRDDKEFTKSVHSDTMGLLARVLGKVFRRANLPVWKHQIAWVSITHVYMPIGQMYAQLQGKGGNALRHWCHLRLFTSRRRGAQNEKVPFQMPDGRIIELIPSYEAVFKVDKTRQSATESQQVAIPFVFNRGLSEDDSVIDMAFTYGVIESSGAWWFHPSFEAIEGNKAGKIHGKDNVIQAIKSNPLVMRAITMDVGTALIQREGIPEKFVAGMPSEDEAHVSAAVTFSENPDAEST